MANTNSPPDQLPAQDWLLRLEAQRYARTPASALSALRAEFRRLAWPH